MVFPMTTYPAQPIFLSTPSARRATLYNGETIRVEVFLSTPSARRATRLACCAQQAEFISIHALREEGDHRH